MKNRSNPVYSLLALGAAVVLVVAVSFVGGVALASRFDDVAEAAPAPLLEETRPTVIEADQTDLVVAFEQNLISIYKNALPSVVNIQVTQRCGGAVAICTFFG